MTREEDAALVQFHLLRCIIPGSLRRLIRCIGGGFRFPPRRCLKKGASSEENAACRLVPDDGELKSETGRR